MSQETIEWLNENVMYGFAAHREHWDRTQVFTQGGKPWFATDDYRHSYPDAIPVDDVNNTLFCWEPLEASCFVRLIADGPDDAEMIDSDGDMVKHIRAENRKAIVRPDTMDVLGVFTDNYQPHSYRQWLIENVASIIDGEVGISSAGLLRRGGQAWVSIELPDDIEVAGAGSIRPCIIAATSLDGTMATTYATRIMRPECDNSLRITLNADGHTLKIKHSSRSIGRLNDARDALGLIYRIGEEAQQWFDALASVDVTDAQFRQIVKQLAPVPDPVVTNGKVTNQRSITIAERKQSEMLNLWADDPRAAPWNGTLAGAFHAVNTWQQHMVSQDDVMLRRQMTGTLSGAFDKADAEFWNVVNGLELSLPELLVAS